MVMVFALHGHESATGEPAPLPPELLPPRLSQGTQFVLLSVSGIAFCFYLMLWRELCLPKLGCCSPNLQELRLC